MKLYGRKNNGIWYKGSLVDIQNKEQADRSKVMAQDFFLKLLYYNKSF